VAKVSKQRAKGTDGENLAVEAVRFFRKDAKRNPSAGTKDVGDVYIPNEHRFILEVKNWVTPKLPEWVREAQVEAANLNGYAVGVVVAKRKGTRDPNKQWVHMELGDFLRLVYELSEPVDWMRQ
jgi:hypothetical protein